MLNNVKYKLKDVTKEHFSVKRQNHNLENSHCFTFFAGIWFSFWLFTDSFNRQVTVTNELGEGALRLFSLFFLLYNIHKFWIFSKKKKHSLEGCFHYFLNYTIFTNFEYSQRKKKHSLEWTWSWGSKYSRCFSFPATWRFSGNCFRKVIEGHHILSRK
jgi:hypothetical protein